MNIETNDVRKMLKKVADSYKNFSDVVQEALLYEMEKELKVYEEEEGSRIAKEMEEDNGNKS